MVVNIQNLRSKNSPQRAATVARRKYGKVGYMIVVTKGGKGSGNFGHAGVPGHVGGSTSGGGSVISTLHRLTVAGGDIGNVSFSLEERELLSQTVQGDDYTLYRGMHIMDFRLTSEQFGAVRNLRPGDPAPDFLTKQGNPYASYTKSPAVAKRYASEGHVQIVIRVQPPKNKIVADTTNLHKLPEFANLMDQETKDYFRGEKEVIVHEPVRAIIFSISGPKAIHPGKISEKQIVVTKGGKGSGNFGHTGRPGEVGGSTSGGSHYGNPPSASDADKEARKERKARRSKIVKDAADKLGIDIPVKYSDQVKTFTVAGNRYKTMGVYRALHKDVIIFNCSGADNPERVGASLAHEYNHHKFNMVIHEPIRTGNATPAQEGLLDKFVEYEILGNPMVESGKSISSYASSFWKAFSKNRTTGAHLIAINETLAEVAKAIHMGKRDSLPKVWVDIYDELDEVYRGLK